MNKRNRENEETYPIPEQEELYDDYYSGERAYNSGGAHLSPEAREKYYAERDAYYARRDAYYAQMDAYYAQREQIAGEEETEWDGAQDPDEEETWEEELPEEEWDEEDEDETPPPAPRRRRARTSPRDYVPEDYDPEEEAQKADDKTRKKAARRRKKRRRRLLRRLLTLLLLAGLAFLLLGEAPVRNPQNLTREASHSTVLLAGTDQEGLRTDTILLVSMENGSPLRLLTIPRDTFAMGYGAYKINSVYAAGGMGEAGMELLLREVGNVLGFEPDGYMLVNLRAVAKVVDCLGGVDYNVPMDMDYDDGSQNLSIHLKAGEQHLNGEQTLGLLRFRAGYANADLGRTEVQRDFVKSAARQWLRPSSLSALPELLEIYRSDDVVTDLSLRNLVWMARMALKSNLGAMETAVLPGWADMWDGSSVYMVDTGAAAALTAPYNPYS